VTDANGDRLDLPWSIRNGMVISGEFLTDRERLLAEEVNRSAARAMLRSDSYARGVEDARAAYEVRNPFLRWLVLMFDGGRLPAAPPSPALPRPRRDVVVSDLLSFVAKWSDAVQLEDQPDLMLDLMRATGCEPAPKVPDDMELRRLMWLGHGHDGLYGDDGEMQCGECAQFGCYDYKRAPIDAVRGAYNAARARPRRV
jgi:hypothetical protein